MKKTRSGRVLIDTPAPTLAELMTGSAPKEYGLLPEYEALLATPVNGLADEDEDEDEEPVEDAVDAVADVISDALKLTGDGVWRRTVTLEKRGGRALDPAKSDVQMDDILAGAMNSDRAKRGWKVFLTVPDEARTKPDLEKGNSDGRYRAVGSKQDGWAVTVDVTVECRPRVVSRTIPTQFENLVVAMHARAKLPRNRWAVIAIDGAPYVPGETAKIEADPNEELGYAPFDLPEESEWLSKFTHLYGLDDYIAIIRSALELAVMSEWQDRVNIALIGPPACGKTEICKAVRAAVGEESVLEYDATSTSMAGAQEQIGQMEELPRVMVLEEIEKAPEAALPWLLSVMDLRGEVRKKTARSEINKSVHMVTICTVNDENRFNSVASGALASRFSMPLYFNRPERDVLWKILKREVDKIGGSVEWIDYAIDFAEELQAQSNGALYIDPRKLIAICLTGRERLLPTKAHPQGEFQEMYRRTMRRTVKPA